MTVQNDIKYMNRVLTLAKEAIASGEAPFAALITRGETILQESINQVTAQKTVTRHAEIIALEQAQRLNNGKTLEGCTMYTICEPCPMCAFMIRELKVSRVVISLLSPKMGGFSRWPILQDPVISKYTLFGQPPEVTTGLLATDALPLFKTVGYEDMFLPLTQVETNHGKK